MFRTVHSIRSLHKLLSNYRDRGKFRTLSKIKPFVRIIITENNQVCNQKFLTAGEVSWNWGTSINNSSKTREKKTPQGNILKFSIPNTLKTTI